MVSWMATTFNYLLNLFNEGRSILDFILTWGKETFSSLLDWVSCLDKYCKTLFFIVVSNLVFEWYKLGDER